MATSDEAATNKAISDVLKALQRARELSERVEYGNLVVEPLANAQREIQYALGVALGRNYVFANFGAYEGEKLAHTSQHVNA